MDTVLSVFIGIGLATACGLRVFIPLLVVSVASHFGNLPLSPGFQWMSSTSALIGFSVASLLEIAGYYIPWVDHLLDTIASPAAVIAGTIVSVALMTNIDPFYKWSLAIIAGGGMAGLMQGTTVVARGASTATTGGIANPLVSTVELIGSVLLSILAVVVPVLAVLLIALVMFFVARWFLRRRRKMAGMSKVSQSIPPAAMQA
ncbi:MAG: putative rane protein [Pedosphaera sp.]|nr:putative rane protein [Pedosphaera sp.]